jgi:TPP-dependent pyruvate/acetoin dehydrogenase alpha subunit
MNNSNNNKNFIYQMLVIRKFDELLLNMFSKGELSGTTHPYFGQEAIAVAAMHCLTEDDIVISNHRCHGHYIAKTGDVEGLLSEIMGKSGGICKGRGGSQHICNKNFYTNGIQGNMIPVASGMAYAEKMSGSRAITTVFIGDGTLGEGALYETYNLISLWSIPILIVVENNQYAQTTHISNNLAGSILKRSTAFNIKSNEIESNDVEVLAPIFEKAVEFVREEQKPFVQIVHTYRLGPHSKGDDFRDSEELNQWKKKDPILLTSAKIDSKSVKNIEESATSRVNSAIATVINENQPIW